MPFARPTLTQLRTNVQADIAAALPGTDSLLRYSNLGIAGEVLAKLTNGQYGYLDFIARQALPFTSTGEYLEGWAALKGVTRKPATAAAGQVTFSGAAGSLIPIGTSIVRSDGAAFNTTADAAVAGGIAVAPVLASAVGAAGNAPVGAPMTLGSGVVGIQSTGFATSALTGGADIEPDDQLRSRMLQAYAAPPQGGARSDYIEWTLAVPGVTRAWVNPNGAGLGSVIVYFMMDDAEFTHGGFPQGSNGVATGEARAATATGDQLTVANYLFNLQPITALVVATAPTPNAISLIISGLLTAPVAVQSAIIAAIVAALKANAQPGGTTYVSTIEAAIASVNGSAGFVILNVSASAGTVSPGVAGNITSSAGALPVLGTVSFA